MAKRQTITLSEEDRDRIQELLDAAGNARPPRPGGIPPEYQWQAPEVFVAKTPAGGISGLDHGSLTGTGTGTDYWYYDQPGYADCLLYRILYTSGVGSTPYLAPLAASRRQTVFNISEDGIPRNTGRSGRGYCRWNSPRTCRRSPTSPGVRGATLRNTD